MHRGGQVSVEYLMVTAFSFLLLIPLLILFQSQSTAVEADLVAAQAYSAAEAIVQSAERVYYAGPPARETITVYIPEHVGEIRFSNESIRLHMLFPGEYDAVTPTPVPFDSVASSVAPQGGKAELRVEATAQGVVVTEA